MTNFGFGKKDRLKRYKTIKALFSGGESIGAYPLRLVWIDLERGTLPHFSQIAFAVGRKHFKKATQRNRIRRLLREAWRLNKHRVEESLEASERDWAFILIYTGKEELPFGQIQSALVKLIDRFSKRTLNVM